MTTPLDVYRQAWTDYLAKHLGPSYDQPPGNSYECDAFIARKVFEAGQRSSVPVPEPGREELSELRAKYDARGRVLAELESKLELFKEEIANLCVDKASLTDRLASANRRIAELCKSVDAPVRGVVRAMSPK